MRRSLSQIGSQGRWGTGLLRIAWRGIGWRSAAFHEDTAFRSAHLRGLCSSASLVAMAVLSLVSGMGCGGTQTPPDIPQERALEAEQGLEEEYRAARTLLDNLERRVDGLSEMPEFSEPSRLDVSLLRYVLQACLIEPVRRDVVEGTTEGEPCAPQHLSWLDAHLEEVSPEAREWSYGRFEEVDGIRLDARKVLVERLQRLARLRDRGELTLDDLTREAERLRERFDERSGSWSGAHRRAFEADLADLLATLDRLEVLLLEVDDEMDDLRRRRRVLVDRTSRAIGSMRAERER